MDPDEIRKAAEKFKADFTEQVYYALCAFKDEQKTRDFFDRCLKAAQARYLDEHKDEIFSAFEAALKSGRK